MACRHPNITFTTKFGRRGNDGMAQMTGHCAQCFAPLIFQPKPSLDGKNFQIPFVYGAPQAAAPAEPEILQIGGKRQAVG